MRINQWIIHELLGGKNTSHLCCEHSSPALLVFSGLWGFPFSAACTCPATVCPRWHLGPSGGGGGRIAQQFDNFSKTHKKNKLFLDPAVQTSASLVLSCPGCFLANSRITSGVLNAWLMAAWIAWWRQRHHFEFIRKCYYSHLKTYTAKPRNTLQI